MTDQRDIGASPDLGATMREARAAAGDAANELASGARSAVAEAGEVAAGKSAEMKDAAAGEIARTAKGLEAAAAELEGSPLQQDLLHEAAEGLKQISQAIEGKSIGTIVEDLSEFGRRNPLAYLGGAALAGFALARFARAAAPDRPATEDDPEDDPRGVWDPDDPMWDPDVGPDEAPMAETPGGSSHG
jgi:hypothetical protein